MFNRLAHRESQKKVPLGCLTAGAEIKEQNSKKMEKSLQVSEIVRKFAALDPVVPAFAYFGVRVFYSPTAHHLSLISTAKILIYL